MQKFDFVKNLETICEELFSEEILKHFGGAIDQPATSYPFGNLKPTLFKSKSNYDQLIKDDDKFEILEGLNASSVYSENNLSALTGYLSSQQIKNIFTVKQCLEFFQFHLAIKSTLKLTKKLLLKEIYSESNEQNLQNGVIIFEAIIEEDSENIELYIKILSLLKEIANIVDKIEEKNQENNSERESVEDVEVILLDSGSNLNIGLKTGVETAKSLFLIFKEIWDFIISHKYYQTKKRGEALLESLTIRKEILQKVEEGVISEAEAKEYIHIIKTRAEDLIGLKVLPKEIVKETKEINSKKVLEEYKELRLLKDR